tara:strand:+ start:143 stop:529 length:387 start_codon:yes stop_codon:yes gene_type:complete
MEVFDFLNDINYRKNSAMKENPDCERLYDPYKVNKFLAQNFDSVLFVNEMNYRPHCDKRLQYEYFINSLRKRKRRANKWIAPESFDDIQCVKEYYNYSTRKAKDALRVLSQNDIEYIKKRLFKGGLKK